MNFEVIRTRSKGRLLMRCNLVAHGRFEGDLVVEEVFVDELHRRMLVARIVDAQAKDVAGLDPLHDVVLTSARHGYWTMTGFERVSTVPGGPATDFYQSWIMCPVAETSRSVPDRPRKSDADIRLEQQQEAAARQAAKDAKEREKIINQWPPRAAP